MTHSYYFFKMGFIERLQKNGYLMICDYFVLNDASGELRKSGHNYDVFMNHIESEGFTVVSEEDITKSVTKTLDLGKESLEKALVALDIGTEKIRNRHPHITKLGLWLFKKKIQKVTKQVELLDSDKFKKYKTYRFILMQVNTQSGSRGF
jgi:MPBQ/MSBQ methyltransferase